jgi:hypothetical protein
MLTLMAGRRVEPLRSPLTEANTITSALSDASSELKLRQERTEFLMRELAQRSKNLLAVVKGMALQTARQAGTVERFFQQFGQRIQGLAESQDLMVRQNSTERPAASAALRIPASLAKRSGPGTGATPRGTPEYLVDHGRLTPLIRPSCSMECVALQAPLSRYLEVDNMPLPLGDISCSSCSVTTPVSIVLVRQKDFLLLVRIKKDAAATIVALGSCGQMARI